MESEGKICHNRASAYGKGTNMEDSENFCYTGQTAGECDASTNIRDALH